MRSVTRSCFALQLLAEGGFEDWKVDEVLGLHCVACVRGAEDKYLCAGSSGCLDAGFNRGDVKGFERHGACRTLEVVKIGVHLAFEMLAGLLDLLEQPAPHS